MKEAETNTMFESVFLFPRQFIEHDLVKFASANPSVVVYLKPRRNRTPVVVAEYRE